MRGELTSDEAFKRARKRRSPEVGTTRSVQRAVAIPSLTFPSSLDIVPDKSTRIARGKERRMMVKRKKTAAAPFKKGDVVLAKFRTYPPWPAIVAPSCPPPRAPVTRLSFLGANSVSGARDGLLAGQGGERQRRLQAQVGRHRPLLRALPARILHSASSERGPYGEGG